VELHVAPPGVLADAVLLVVGVVLVVLDEPLLVAPPSLVPWTSFTYVGLEIVHANAPTLIPTTINMSARFTMMTPPRRRVASSVP
jgi:hypothetical protein